MLFSTLTLLAFLASTPVAPQAPPPQKPKTEKKLDRKPDALEPARPENDADSALERAVEAAGNDRAVLVRNLKEYLERFPDSPRRNQVYRAIVESSLQLGHPEEALEFTERLIALQPDDLSLLLLAVDLLERQGDDHSLTKAVGYVTRVADRVEKAIGSNRPTHVSAAEWIEEQNKLLMSLYLIRGRLQMQGRKYDDATNDLEKSYALLPSPAAALRLGELAEMRAQYERAIEHYLNAFTLTEDYGIKVDRTQLRHALRNAWRLAYGSDAGLGERILAAYDRQAPTAAKEVAPKRNEGAGDLNAFVLRKMDGGGFRISDPRGKVVVLSFWATWCLPCREVERSLSRMAEVRGADVVFISANCDDNADLARAYVEREKLRTTVVFEDGLRTFLSVKGLPTVVVFDRDGRVVYRGDGFAPANFETEISGAIQRALGPPPQP